MLIIDNMGPKVLPATSSEIPLELIMRRYENRSTMMNSNRSVEEWGKLCDVPASSAILDRLLHHAEIIAIHGLSYRVKEGAADENQRQTSQTKREKSAASPRE